MTRRIRWELISCALHGHVYVGVGAASIKEKDNAFVREYNGARWHRCLRCDDWSVPVQPASQSSLDVPSRDQVTLPLRGPLLRDRYVLRLIALDRAVHVLFLSGIAIALLLFLGHRGALQDDYNTVVNSLLGSTGNSNSLSGILGSVHKLFLFNPRHLYELAFAAIAYAALEATEMVGLWLTKRWAEYLTFVATALLLPLEIFEIATKVSVLKIIVFVLNAAIVVYLLLAKRLFGLRGGYRAEARERRETSGWAAFDAATLGGPKG